ncbi:MAG: hypothetical protein R6U04_03640 [Bacteroidales bacterium]
MRRSIVLFVIVFVLALALMKFTIKFQKNMSSLKNENFLLRRNADNLVASLELTFKSDSIELLDDFNKDYIIYYPSGACFVCLEKLLLYFDNNYDINEKILIYVVSEESYAEPTPIIRTVS